MKVRNSDFGNTPEQPVRGIWGTRILALPPTKEKMPRRIVGRTDVRAGTPPRKRKSSHRTSTSATMPEREDGHEPYPRRHEEGNDVALDEGSEGTQPYLG